MKNRVDTLVAELHSLYEQVSIETQLVRSENNDDDWAGMTARITTPKGVFSAWSIRNMDELDFCENEALTNALNRAGIGLALAQFGPTLRAAATTLDEAAEVLSKVEIASSFQSVVDTDAETAQNVENVAISIICTRCGNPIGEYETGTYIMPAEMVAEKTTNRHGAPYCGECSVAIVATPKRSRAKKAT